MKYLLSILTIIPILSHAGLPYEGATSCKTSINRPTAEIMKSLDAGYEVDKDCKVVFILPPKRGNAIISSSFLTGAADYCEFFQETKKLHAQAKRLQRKMNQSLIQGSDLEAIEIEKIKESMRYNAIFLDELKDDLKGFESTVGLSSKIYFETDWDQLVSEYAKANPDKFVKKIPTAASMLSINSVKKGLGADILSESSFLSNGVYSIVMPGTRMSSSIDLMEFLGIEDVSESSILFGNSVSAQLNLNLHGMCNVKDFFQNRSTSNMSLSEVNRAIMLEEIDAQIVANLNVWYPVQLNKSYKVELDVNKVTQQVTDFLKTKTTFSTSEFVDMMESVNFEQNIKITFSSEHPNQEEKNEIEVLKTKILDDVIIKMINQVATELPESFREIDVDVPSDPHVYRTYTNRICRKRRRWFSSSTKCWTRTHRVKESVTGRASATVKTIRNFSAKYNEQVNYFSTILRSTTLAFTKKI